VLKYRSDPGLQQVFEQPGFGAIDGESQGILNEHITSHLGRDVQGHDAILSGSPRETVYEIVDLLQFQFCKRALDYPGNRRFEIDLFGGLIGR